MVPADKATNNVVVVCRLHYTNTLKQELNGTMAYEETYTNEKSVVNSHSNELSYKLAVNANERQDKVLTMYWLPKLHKRLYKARFIANSSYCTTTVKSMQRSGTEANRTQIQPPKPKREIPNITYSQNTKRIYG